MWKAIIIACSFSTGECIDFSVAKHWFQERSMCNVQLMVRWDEVIESGSLSKITGGYHIHMGCEKYSRVA